jgi:hypothetical protein
LVKVVRSYYDVLKVSTFELTTGVMLRVQAFQAFARNMGIDLCGGNIRVPQQ